MAISYAYEYHATVGEGLTIRTEPPAGELVPEGTDVVIYVSLGTAPVSSFVFTVEFPVFIFSVTR